ncbi:radical SAM protein [Raoultibacter massiliensis]|uniref:SPL family radical SAM protein n=1 Tax=Raoultibacter massiliensis TaxID=1852371 RepID=UPI003A8CF532
MKTIKAKSILQKVRYDNAQWFGIDYNMNLYKGCCHGCIYCDSRSDCYRIDKFDEVRVKFDALAILNRELRSRRNKGVVGIGAMSDTYNPFERELEITRGALQLIDQYGFGVSIDTKGALVTRDIDVLQRISQQHSAIVKLTVTTTDDALASIIEPGAPSPSRRLAALRELADANLFCGILFTPLLPHITDDDASIESMVEAAHQAGARFIYSMGGVTMRTGQKEYFLDHLKAVSPSLPQRYREEFGDRYLCNSPRKREALALLRKLCKEAGLLYRMPDIIDAYKKREPNQMGLF